MFNHRCVSIWCLYASFSCCGLLVFSMYIDGTIKSELWNVSSRFFNEPAYLSSHSFYIVPVACCELFCVLVWLHIAFKMIFSQYHVCGRVEWCMNGYITEEHPASKPECLNCVGSVMPGLTIGLVIIEPAHYSTNVPEVWCTWLHSHQLVYVANCTCQLMNTNVRIQDASGHVRSLIHRFKF